MLILEVFTQKQTLLKSTAWNMRLFCCHSYQDFGASRNLSVALKEINQF